MCTIRCYGELAMLTSFVIILLFQVGGLGTPFFISMPKIIFKNFQPFKNYAGTMTVQNIDVVCSISF